MNSLWYLLPALACPLGMAIMMWLMIRPRDRAAAADGAAERRELADLRSQIAAWHQAGPDPPQPQHMTGPHRAVVRAHNTAAVGADR